MRLRWTEPAVLDLTAICDYVKDRDGDSAARRIALTIWLPPDRYAGTFFATLKRRSQRQSCAPCQMCRISTASTV